MSTELFKEMRKMGDLYGERMDCAVIAMAIATLTPYNQMHSIYKTFKRKDRRRTPHEVTNNVFEYMMQKKINNQSTEALFGKKIPVSKIGQYLPKGTYLCHTRGHIIALVDGVVHDWTNGRKHMVYVISEL